MSPAMIGLGVIAALVLGFVVLYNSLVAARQGARNAWAQISVQLKRRHELIPNLVETVKGAAAHEKQTLEAVVAARAQATGAQTPEDQVRAENGLSHALRGLLMVAENYPALKANQNFLSLQEELASTENRVSFARQHYNDAVTSYNTAVGTVPRNLIAGAFGFAEMPLFELESAEEKRVPQVKF